MSKLAIVSLIITASVPSFRRAGTTFTDAGKAFPEGYFTEEQLNAIHKEKKLSVREVPHTDAIPEGVDTSLISAALTASAAEEKTKEKKTASQAAPTKSTGTKATGKASTTNDTGASA